MSNSAIEPEMVTIPQGILVSGQPVCPQDSGLAHPWHAGDPVHIASFQLARYTVTNAEYLCYIESEGIPLTSHLEHAGFDDPTQPVVAISWYDAVQYCRWLSKQSGRCYRLPHDMEWEYAARGGPSGLCFPWGDEITVNDACYGGKSTPIQVGSFAANEFGLYDLIGNVWEWCEDRFNDVAVRSHAINSPTNKPPDDNKVLRGGSYLTTNELNLWTAYRHEDPPDLRHECIGFRVAI